jgi:hypothetical protein
MVCVLGVTMSDTDRPQRLNWFLGLGFLFSALLLVLFGWLRTIDSPALKLEAQWLWVSAVPLIVLAIAGGFVLRGKYGETELAVGLNEELNSKLLKVESQPQLGTNTRDNQVKIASNESSSEPDWIHIRENEFKRTSG